MATGASHGTYARFGTNPVGKSGVEYLDEILPDVVTHPFIEYGAEEVTPLFGRDREVSNRRFYPVLEGGEVTPVGMRNNTFNNRGELYVTAPYLFEKVMNSSG